ncbi:MAG TPA: undecaprenyldiphospho-muramoylpentapeptide beta-N-acetylglucosaminyltransferase [Bacteroidia bacterium]|nr:undecaprenyldiphospho-muramoylpentapeptide beta-N-acetylglucosaminyltransferase [Bacteroidia bacterium]
MNQPINIIISGGGTGGHIYPAVAIANALRELKPDINILFIGANGRMEMEKVPASGFNIKGIDIIGLQRKLTLSNFLIPYYIFKSVQQVKKIFQTFKPNAVIGTGGYVSFPVLLTAQLQSIPTYIQEQNAYAGLANKLLAKRTSKIFVAFENLEKFFPKDKIIVSGNPVRSDILNLNSIKDDALKFFNLKNNQPVVLVLGGSLGARTINNTIAENIEFFIQNNVQLIWQMGKNYFQQISNELKQKLQQHSIFFSDFITQMNYAYAASDIIISRAGASTIAELAIVGKPSILIPSPNVTDDHQTKNAMALLQKNACVLINDGDVKNTLIQNIQTLIKNKELQQTLSQNIKKFAKPDSAKIIAQTILNDILNNKSN